MRVQFSNVDGALRIFIALSDRTRLEILNHILRSGSQGLTAADVSRLIDKKIPSTLHQLEILKAANLLEDTMLFVESIGREIKHWSVPAERRRIVIDFSLFSLSQAAEISVGERLALLYTYRTRTGQSRPLSKQALSEIVREFNAGRPADSQERLTENGIIDALAVEIFDRFRTSSPPLVDADLFDEVNNLSAEVGTAVRDVLMINDRVSEEFLQGRQRVFRFHS
ncbi:MAG TPA: hypothetical protein VJ044_01560, partial [Candidatus Hodarchaeales archaeon]|nr:hypothetical protein [Candidatus Hodarchaeales archaeon]